MGTTKIEKSNDSTDIKDSATAKAADAKKAAAKNAKAASTKVTSTKAVSTKDAPSVKASSGENAPPVMETAIKSSVKKAASSRKKTSSVYVQYAQKEIDTENLLDSIKAAYNQSENAAAVKSIELYIKPEENTAYYVINGDSFGSVSL